MLYNKGVCMYKFFIPLCFVFSILAIEQEKSAPSLLSCATIFVAKQLKVKKIAPKLCEKKLPPRTLTAIKKELLSSASWEK